ncbi:hypothetical protein DIPPA_21708 [Diplonema papillatum]|nr:hypothetical protein DIPPA_21708 [Diplonema papillatum]
MPHVRGSAASVAASDYSVITPLKQSFAPPPPASSWFRVLVSQEHDDGLGAIVLYDSYRSTPECDQPHPDELSVTSLLQVMHGTLPMRLEQPFTKVHWFHTRLVTQFVVTKLFKPTLSSELADSFSSAAPSPKHSPGVPNGTAASGDLFRCRNAFAVAFIISLPEPPSPDILESMNRAPFNGSLSRTPSNNFGCAGGGAGSLPNNTPGGMPTSMCSTGTPRAKPRAPSLAPSVTSLVDTHSAMDGDTAFFTTEPVCDSDYAPNLNVYHGDGRPKNPVGLLDVIQAHFSFVDSQVEELLAAAVQALRERAAGYQAAGMAAFHQNRSRMKAYDLHEVSAVADCSERVSSVVAAFLFPLYLVREKQTSSLSTTTATIMPYLRFVYKNTDFTFLTSLVTAALTYHQAWIENTVEGSAPPRNLHYCKFLIHSRDTILLQAILNVLSFFVKCGEMCHSCRSLATYAFPPPVDDSISADFESSLARRTLRQGTRQPGDGPLSGCRHGSAFSFDMSPPVSPPALPLVEPASGTPSPTPADGGVIRLVAAAVAVATVSIGERAWDVPHASTFVQQVARVPSSTYSYGAVTANAATPFLMAGLPKEDVASDEIDRFIAAKSPKWMPGARSHRCVVADVKKRKVYLYSHGKREKVESSPMLHTQLRVALDSMKSGVPEKDAEDCLKLGVSEFVTLGLCASKYLASKPKSTFSIDRIKNKMFGASSGDIPLIMSVCRAFEPRLSSSGCGEDKVYSLADGDASSRTMPLST